MSGDDSEGKGEQDETHNDLTAQLVDDGAVLAQFKVTIAQRTLHQHIPFAQFRELQLRPTHTDIDKSTTD
jgi:hypothetical protein